MYSQHCERIFLLSTDSKRVALDCSLNVRCTNKYCSLRPSFTSTSTFLSFSHTSFGIRIQMCMRLNTTALKWCVHVTEGIPNTCEILQLSVKNCATVRKITIAATPTGVCKNEQQSIIQFLILKNVLGGDIHTRMCMVYGVENVITKSTVNQ